MKSLKSLLILAALLGGFTFGQAKTTIKVYPKAGVIVTKLHHPRVYVHKGVRFHYAQGVWYRPHGKRYVVTSAPVGIVVRSLPRGRKVVRVNGRKYYSYNGVWYRKSGRGYKVVIV